MAESTAEVHGGQPPSGEAWRHGRACRSWTASYIHPLRVRSGDALRLIRTDEEWPGWVWVCAGDSNEGWMPARFITETEPHHALCDYDAMELTVVDGEALLLGREVDGWIHCATVEGDEGWLPAHCCEVLHRHDHG